MSGWTKLKNKLKDIFFDSPRLIIINLYRLVVRIRVFNKQRLPVDKPFILAINHVTGADPFIILGAFRKRIIFFAGSGNFTNIISNFFMRRFAGAVPVFKERALKNLNTFKEVFDLSKNKNMVFGIFPEGSLNKKDGFKKLHKGVAYMSYKMKIPILPVYIDNIRKGFGKDRFLGRFTVLEGISAILLNTFNKINVYIGNPIDPIAENIISDFKDLKSKSPLRELTDDINEALEEEFHNLKKEAEDFSYSRTAIIQANHEIDIDIDDDKLLDHTERLKG